MVLRASNVDGCCCVLLRGRAIGQCSGADIDGHAFHRFQACVAKCIERFWYLKGEIMVLLTLLPGPSVPTGPKEPSESRNAARKKEHSNPRFA